MPSACVYIPQVNEYRKLKRKLGLDGATAAPYSYEDRDVDEQPPHDDQPPPGSRRRGGRPDSAASGGADAADADGAGGAAAPASEKRRKKPFNALEALARQEQAAREEREAERQKVAALRQEREAGKAAAAKQRKMCANPPLLTVFPSCVSVSNSQILSFSATKHKRQSDSEGTLIMIFEA